MSGPRNGASVEGSSSRRGGSGQVGSNSAEREGLLRKDQVAPADNSKQNMAPESAPAKVSFRNRIKRKQLSVDTNATNGRKSNATPKTASSSAVTPAGVRGKQDLRSPGGKKSPRTADENTPIPDLITQTDAYGNATTPRTNEAIQTAKEEEQLEVDPCDTLLDSLRLMCCCLVPEDENKAAEEPALAEEHESTQVKLLPEIHPDDQGKKCLVLDLDETLVHSSFRAVPGADFVIPVQIEDVVHFVYVAKRPGVDEFLLEMAKHYEIVIYTASLNKYADPLLDLLDPHGVIRFRLFRESCVYYEGNYVKDLSLLDRELKDTIIVDNSPSSYIFHPENAIDCSSFIDDPRDRELDQIGAFLAGIRNVGDVRDACYQWRDWPNISVNLNGR